MLMTSDLLPQATALVLGIPYRTRGTLMAWKSHMSSTGWWDSIGLLTAWY
jgi:hypothetical protein